MVIKPPHVGMTKDSGLSPEDDLLEIVDLDEKSEDEVNSHLECIITKRECVQQVIDSAVFILIQPSLQQARSVSAVPGVKEAPIPVDAPSPCVESAVQPVGEGEVKEKSELSG